MLQGKLVGLAQSFKFEYTDQEDLTNFLDWLCESGNFIEKHGKWVVTEYKSSQMSFEITPNANGLIIHRSGNYFAYLGFFIEQITGKYGQVSIEDL